MRVSDYPEIIPRAPHVTVQLPVSRPVRQLAFFTALALPIPLSEVVAKTSTFLGVLRSSKKKGS